MNNMPPVSIYIITYLDSEARGKILLRTCEWVLRQRYPDFEVVVSDNGGDYAAKDALISLSDSRLRICENEGNAGFTGNINRCIEHCSHDIIKPMCDDDLLHLDFLSVTVPLVDDETYVVVDVEKFLFETDPENIACPLDGNLEIRTRSPGYRSDVWVLPYASSSIPSATLFTRRMFEALGRYDVLAELSDWDFLIEACIRRKVVHVEQCLCYVGVWGGTDTELQLSRDPFYFSRESLYTKFRILRQKELTGKEHAGLLLFIWKCAAWEGLRLFRHLFSRIYRDGYTVFLKSFGEFIFLNKGRFGR